MNCADQYHDQWQQLVRSRTVRNKSELAAGRFHQRRSSSPTTIVACLSSHGTLGLYEFDIVTIMNVTVCSV
jgi:hypothetical protein